MSMRKMHLGSQLYAVVVTLYGGTRHEQEVTMGPYTDLTVAKRFRTQENKRIAKNVVESTARLKAGPPTTGFYADPRHQASWIGAQEKWAFGSHRTDIFTSSPTWLHTNF